MADRRSIRTPLARVRGLGSAKHGTEAFILERLTSTALLILVIYIVAVVIRLIGEPRDVVVRVIGSIYVAPALIAFILVNCIHMRLGMQSIIEDYCHATVLKSILLIANWLFCWAVALVSCFAVLVISFR
ncbi:succinate dehydrogenase, hydrophobic membrane anchor protein [Mesorhizobium sp. CO1-1-7]|uniref:succinate dehydrogenase, hydrophobic membrane anchor protein n=1 Tax=unclassified Mesorhizobium TaxID=325217 RepID=UPI00112D6A16|nr:MULTISPECIES: succinate dehydrogenase, hydrophobic membrane anchor protein [unclassified Mesorhizobium]MBZ9748174.1 succinate dehydrogenase, hydrophobic membrane anchor protein [Mesorhizobium sp. CO1-1-7]TPL99515.1 succinate dehydrogenase, hydrophobic membrane anchor protein [Mesorhizobium sp. B2-3-10]